MRACRDGAADETLEEVLVAVFRSTTAGPSAIEVVRSVARCALVTAGLLARGRLALPRRMVGARLAFGDGTRCMVFRETAKRARPPTEPVILVVRFRLDLVGTHPLPHAVFRRVCVVNTPLFAGFPGFFTKLWITDTDTGTYRGVYEWDGAAAAEHYARVLSRVLASVSVRGSVQWRILPGIRREDYLSAPGTALADC